MLMTVKRPHQPRAGGEPICSLATAVGSPFFYLFTRRTVLFIGQHVCYYVNQTNVLLWRSKNDKGRSKGNFEKVDRR